MDYSVKTNRGGKWDGLPIYEESLMALTGGRTSIVAQVVVRDPENGHFCKSMLLKQWFRLKCDLSPDTVEVSVLNAQVTHFRRPTLLIDERSYVMQHKQRCTHDYMRLTETCAGIGGLGQGAQYAGWKTCVQNEIQESFASHQQQYGDAPVVQGDICHMSTLIRMFEADDASAIMAWGFSCQPFSRLGDNRQGSDSRSHTLPFGLYASYVLRKEILVLECVAEASASAFVQQCLDYHMKLTRSERSETFLELSDVWPSCRRRWWTVIARSEFGKIMLSPLPKLVNTPTWLSLLPDYLDIPDHELQQVMLTQQEYEAFQNYGKGAASQVIDKSKPLGTALHAWGNQVHACACGCRSGLSMERLRKQGLFGALVGWMNDLGEQHFRHISAREMALFVGLVKKDGWQADQRLLMAGLGQIASPIQSAWVFSQIRCHLHAMKLAGVTECNPKSGFGSTDERHFVTTR